VTELAARILTAFAMIAVALLAAVAGGYAFAVLVAAAATAMFYEWLRIVRGWGLAWSAGGFVYCLAPALALLWIRDRSGDDGLALLLWVFLVTWATDIGAYFVGRTIGGRKLMPSVSPGKTVSGAIGGVVVTVLVAWVYVRFALRPAAQLALSAAGIIVFGVVISIVAQIGDLFESLLKREAGVKDSSKLLPGHGGVLDRLDSLFFVLPVAHLLLGWLLVPAPR
jgi:phosphatidate cytidylyltransferase